MAVAKVLYSTLKMIVPQAIGKTLTGVSLGKEISKGNATEHTTTQQEEGIKERNDKTKD